MADAMSLWIARQPELAELVGPNPSRRMSDILVTGGFSMKYLTEVASDCEIHELLQMAVPRSNGRRYESLYFPAENRTLSPLPSVELLLGSLIHDAPREPAELLAMDAFSETRLTFRRNAIATASTIAFKRQKHRVEKAARRVKTLFPDI